MKSRTFEEFFNTIQQTSNELNDLVDFKKVISNVSEIEMHLNSLNFLLTNNEKDFYKKLKLLFENNKKCLLVIPILLGIREPEKCLVNLNDNVYCVSSFIDNYDNLLIFFKKTGLLNFIINKNIKNFVDYVFGVEVGLDSNSRKNRTGKKREEYIFSKLNEAFNEREEIQVLEQQKMENIEKYENKVYDFLIINKKNNKKVYIECSFYNAGGSKISETARAYEQIYQELKDKNITNVSFLWLADGKGVKTIKKLLEKNFNKGYIVNTKQLIDEIKKKID